jgi:hypothetical protein
LYSSSDYRRLGVVADYGMMLQGRDWDFEKAMPFFDFIQQHAPR